MPVFGRITAILSSNYWQVEESVSNRRGCLVALPVWPLLEFVRVANWRKWERCHLITHCRASVGMSNLSALPPFILWCESLLLWGILILCKGGDSTYVSQLTNDTLVRLSIWTIPYFVCLFSNFHNKYWLICPWLLQKLKTRVIKKDVNPEWDEDLTLSVSNPHVPIHLVTTLA